MAVRKKRGVSRYSKRGQVESQLNWIFILIVGAVILVFFTGLVLKFKDSADTKLEARVLKDLDSIMTGASISTDTSHTIQVPTESITFECDQSGYSEFSLSGTGIYAATPFVPLFSLGELKGKELITKALDWAVPFRVTNFLLITTKRQSFVFLIPIDEYGGYISYDENTVTDEFEQYIPFDTMKINFAFIGRHPLSGEYRIYDPEQDLSRPMEDWQEYINTDDLHIRFILLLNEETKDIAPTPSLSIDPAMITFGNDMRKVDDERISLTAVMELFSAIGDEAYNGAGRVFFYRKEENTFTYAGENTKPYPDPVYYLGKSSAIGAMFSRDATYYSCNMRKAHILLETISAVYQKRSSTLKNFTYGNCPAYLSESELLVMNNIIAERNNFTEERIEDNQIIYPYIDESNNEFQHPGNHDLSTYVSEMNTLITRNDQARRSSCPVIY